MKKNILLMTLSPFLALKRNKIVVRKRLNNAKPKNVFIPGTKSTSDKFSKLDNKSQKGIVSNRLNLKPLCNCKSRLRGKASNKKKNDFLFI